MRLLILDHFFEQDIDALRAAAPADVDIRVLPYAVPRDEALRIFPEDVASGLVAFAEPRYEPYRRRYACWLERFLEDEYRRRPFDVFVVPSDEFFYLRAAPDICHRLGVPFFVLQKETTRSTATIREHAPHVKEHAPPIGDFQTVCSARHEHYSVRTGWDPAKIRVTGQPRFDWYARPELWPTALPYGGAGPSVLFLSYLVDAYHPTEGEGTPAWEALHRQTEEGLWKLADEGWRVLIKPHPQQDFAADRRRIEAEVGSKLGERVFLVPSTVDLRTLLGVDVVVGFQTTGLFEAMLARRPVVYTGWDPEALRLSEDLIPFHTWDDIVNVARRPEELPELVAGARGKEYDDRMNARAREIAGEFLGPIDGHAAERALAVIREYAAAFSRDARPAPARPRRHPLVRARSAVRQRTRVLRRRVGAALGR